MNRTFEQLGSFYQNTQSRLYTGVHRVPGLGWMLDAWIAYSQDQMGILAAALAYYLLLSLFPLLLLLIALASPFLASEAIIRQAARFVGSYLPTVGPEVGSVLHQALTVRGPATFIAGLGLLWSASGVFDVLQRGLDRAWRVPHPRPLWRQRLISVATVLILGVLFGLSFMTSALTRVGIHLRFNVGDTSVEVVGFGLTLLLNLLLFTFMYRFFPNRSIPWRQVWGPALLASILWEVAKYVFVWYLLNFAQLSLIYGSVGIILALLIWGYITATILLLGAELCALPTRQGNT